MKDIKQSQPKGKKQVQRLRRAAKTKARLRKEHGRAIITVYRSINHIYAQIGCFDNQGQSKVLVSASTKDTELKAVLSGTKVEQAAQVGKLLAQRAITKQITEVAFDRSGYKYHGRVKALAESAREAGLIF